MCVFLVAGSVDSESPASLQLISQSRAKSDDTIFAGQKSLLTESAMLTVINTVDFYRYCVGTIKVRWKVTS